jgi:hypothetical protein
MLLYTYVPVDALPKAWVCSRSPAEIVGSNPAEGIDIFLFLVLFVVMRRSLRLLSYRVLLNVVCRGDATRQEKVYTCRGTE